MAKVHTTPTRRHPPWLAWALTGCLSAGGCAPTAVDLYESQWIPSPVPTTYDDRDYATVLRENVRDGLVDYDHLNTHPDPLFRYVGLLSVVGPESTPGLFPTRSDRVAYWLNAYNAAVLRFVLYRGIPETMHDVRLVSFEQGHRIRIDGKMRSVAELHQAVRSEAEGDAWIEFCLCDAAKGSPPLQDQPFRPDTLSRVVRRLAQQAMDSPVIVRIDHEHQRLLVARTLHLRRQEFIDFASRRTGTRSATILTALLDMAASTRREWLNTAVGYSAGVIPFDRALNRWKPAKTGG